MYFWPSLSWLAQNFFEFLSQSNGKKGLYQFDILFFSFRTADDISRSCMNVAALPLFRHAIVDKERDWIEYGIFACSTLFLENNFWFCDCFSVGQCIIQIFKRIFLKEAIEAYSVNLRNHSCLYIQIFKLNDKIYFPNGKKWHMRTKINV